MLELGDDVDLAEEPLGAQRRGELGPQDLERDLAVVLEVVGEVDGGHAALAELALDAVAAAEGGTQSFQGCGRCGRQSYPGATSPAKPPQRRTLAGPAIQSYR